MKSAQGRILLPISACSLSIAAWSSPPVLSQSPRPSSTKAVTTAAKPLSEATRKQIYWEGFAIEHKAERAAKARYPVDPSSPDFLQQLKANQAYGDTLIAKDENALRRRYGITEGEYNMIIVDGVKKGWPRPSSQQ